MVRMHGFDTRWVQNYTMYAMFFHGAVEVTVKYCIKLIQKARDATFRNQSFRDLTSRLSLKLNYFLTQPPWTAVEVGKLLSSYCNCANCHTNKKKCFIQKLNVAQD